MKKLLLLFVAVAMCISCSDDDDNKGAAPSSLKATINGIDYNFTTFDTHKETYTEDDYTWTDVEIDAALSNDSTRHITFVIEQGVLGPDASWRFTYFLNNDPYDKTDDFTFVVTESTENFAKGTFSGTVENSEGEQITITNGTFSVRH